MLAMSDNQFHFIVITLLLSHSAFYVWLNYRWQRINARNERTIAKYEEIALRLEGSK